MLAGIRQDAEACAARGKYLRVMIQHRYANFPAYMRQGDRHSFSIRDNTPNPGEAPPRVLKLDQPESLKLLEGLYAQVIATLQGSADARKGFYGFVIQETALGESPYLTRPIETAWYANLRAFHQWLAMEVYCTLDLLFSPECVRFFGAAQVTKAAKDAKGIARMRILPEWREFMATIAPDTRPLEKPRTGVPVQP